MKKLFFLLIVLVSGLTVMAQDAEENGTQNRSQAQQAPFIGYLSCDSLLHSMPQYAVVKAQMRDLRQAYEEELKRVEDDFNQKYEAFLDGQKDFPRTILLKRQNELQELLQKNVAFRQQGLRDLQQAEAEALAPLRQQLGAAIAKVSKRLGLALVVNTDSDACPFIAPETAVDLTDEVRAHLSK
ncbi:MAG: OmpH family outer membrane protein [Prevotella sp.]|nr:OmpH family outer membrane protein [Prevotella sp.]